MTVKPIFKKLSHSEKNSLDLDRGWDEQDDDGWRGFYDSGAIGRSARDVNFSSFGDSAVAGSGVGGNNGSSGRKFHVRSTSGNSVVSNGSGGHRTGTFVHPFQQTPRTSEPPLLSYPNSRASFENNAGGAASAAVVNGAGRDCSPTITENEDDEVDPRSSFSQRRSFSNHFHQHRSSNVSQSSLRRPSFTSQRTSSFSDANPAGPGSLRIINTLSGRSTQGPSSRLAHGVLGPSNSDLHLNLAILDSPTTTTAAATPPLAPMSSSATPMSPLRSSFEGLSMGIPRLRSRSEVDTAARAEHIRQARRRFEERERAKAEKWDREQIRKQERRGTKEASRLERQARKNSNGGITPVVSSDEAPAAEARPAACRQSMDGSGTGGSVASKMRTKSNTSTSPLGDAQNAAAEKQTGFSSSNYANVPGGARPSFGPGVDGVQFKPTKRTKTAKRKTQGYWNGFILWLRTRLLRLGRRD